MEGFKSQGHKQLMAVIDAAIELYPFRFRDPLMNK